MAVRFWDLALVALGGAAGSLLRYAVGTAVPHPAGGWPWATLAVNVVASLLLGLAAGWAHWRHAAHWVRPLLMTGVLGGFSTYSAFAVDTVVLADTGHAGLAVAYVALTVVGCVGAVAVGTAVARRLWRRP